MMRTGRLGVSALRATRSDAQRSARITEVAVSGCAAVLGICVLVVAALTEGMDGAVVAPRIINGTPAAEGEFPFAAYGIFCGGVLIAPRFVLTAAHCSYSENDIIVLGAIDISIPGAGEIYTIVDTTKHPDWNENTLNFDFQLLELDRDATHQPAVLFAGTLQSNAQTVAVGWGLTETGKVSTVLLKATLPVVSNESCASEFKDMFNKDSMLCAGRIDGSADSCSGDSGGPLLLENNIVVGLTSFGPFPCAQRGRRAVYARVTAAVPWIDAVFDDYRNRRESEPSPSPISGPNADDESDNSVERDASCFPAHAVVQLPGGAQKAMADLDVGDVVLTENGEYSPIFAFSHREQRKSEQFVAISTRAQRKLVLSRGHYVRISGAGLRVAGKVRIGDALINAIGERDEVIAVGLERYTGVYSPQTLSGTLIVDGIVASCYTNLVLPSVTRAVAAPLRWLYQSAPNSASWLLRLAPRWTGLFQNTAQRLQSGFVNLSY
mmetsp:Transcript_13129/g.35358  ORF Transcript_13129/g.35358 Transcript_13129/m.35358 type:complete len:494 (-) Transcript_13129:1280-2761(-)